MDKTSRWTWLPITLAGLWMTFCCWLLALQRPLFHDEASTIIFCEQGLSHLFSMLQQDVHPPAYFLTMWGLIKAVGPVLEPLRLFSCLCMGAAVMVFLRGMWLWFGRPPGLMMVVVVATCPFLIFSGYFARYYALACLLGVVVFLQVIKGLRQDSLRTFIGAGCALALLFLTNYACALLAVAGCIPAGLALLRKGRIGRVMALVLPLTLVAGAWSPFLLEQLSADIPNRVDGMPGVAHAAKSAGILAWTLAVSDGVMPWSPEGAPLVILWLLVQVAALRVAWRNGQGYFALSGLLLLVMGAIIGWLLMPDSGYAFLPPRVALCGFAWLALVALLLAGITRAGRRLVLGITLVLCNLWGAATMIFLQRTTNWAYTLPAQEVASAVETAVLDDPQTTAIYLPRKSFGNIYFYLRQMAENQPLMVLQPATAEEVSGVGSVIIVRQSRSEEWPPRQAVKGETVTDPEGEWHKVKSMPFVTEDASAGKLKERLSGQEIYPDKLRVERWIKQ